MGLHSTRVYHSLYVSVALALSFPCTSATRPRPARAMSPVVCHSCTRQRGSQRQRDRARQREIDRDRDIDRQRDIYTGTVHPHISVFQIMLKTECMEEMWGRIGRGFQKTSPFKDPSRDVAPLKSEPSTQSEPRNPHIRQMWGSA